MAKVEHIYWEGNRVTEFLAGLGHNLSIGVHSISISDPLFSHHILYDLLNISQTRLIMNE
ncbi:hypothetical protein LINPERPRIM_LOCUS18809 [Linum perenne]